ncbi:MAG: hypothetical protein ACLU4N_10565 [Butyricimonas faecihominis]
MNEGRGTLRPFQVFGHPSLIGMPYSYVPRPIKGMSMQPKCKGKLVTAWICRENTTLF